ncbi:MAG: hypothetical protein AAFP69_10955 [Planctomycetota bacterium]
MVLITLRMGVLMVGLDQLSSDDDQYRNLAETLAQTGTYGLRDAATGDAYPSAFRPPLYPWTLSWFVDSAGNLHNLPAACVNGMLGVLTLLLVALCTRQVLADHASPSHIDRATALAVFLVGIDPVLLRQSTLVMTETMATFFSALLLWLWVTMVRQNAEQAQAASRFFGGHFTVRLILIGATMGIAFLCRPTFLVQFAMLVFLMMVAGVWAWIQSRTRDDDVRQHHFAMTKRMLTMIAWTTPWIVLVISSWTFRNAMQLGHPVWATTHGGYTILLANNPSFYDYLNDQHVTAAMGGPAWDSQPFFDDWSRRYQWPPVDPKQSLTRPVRDAAFWEWAASNPRQASIEWPTRPGTDDDSVAMEVLDNGVAGAAAMETIRRRPGDFVFSCVVRLLRLWSPLPMAVPGRSPLRRYAVGCFYLVVFGVCGIAAVRHRHALFSQVTWMAIACVLSLSLLHTVYWSNLRMRCPATPAIAILAAMAICKRKE